MTNIAVMATGIAVLKCSDLKYKVTCIRKMENIKKVHWLQIFENEIQDYKC